MAYYDALITKWNTLTGTTAEKLAAINALTTAGPNIDVPVSSVIGLLMLNGAYLKLQAFSQSATTGDTTHDNALEAAKLLMALVGTPNAPPFNMSNATNYATIKGMMDAILAEEIAVPDSTGFTQSVHDALLALCATTVTWCSANGYPDAQNGGGGITDVDLQNAGGLT